MELSIDVIDYKIIQTLDKAPHTVDWGALELNKETDDMKKEYTSWSFEVNKQNGGNEVVISSNINIPCGPVHPDMNTAILEGTFYRYEGETKFQVNVKEVSPTIVAELALFHFGRFAPIIAVDTHRKTNGKYVHSTVIYSLAKLFLTAEQGF